jgi:hypothetical protein
MHIFPTAKFVMISVPRTGGRSLREFFYRKFPEVVKNKHPRNQHRTLESVETPFLRENYKNFAFIRNPWDRWLSLYHALPLRLEQESFTEFVKKNLLPRTWPNIPQARFVKGIKFLGRYETYTEDVDRLANYLEIDITLDHYNKTDHNHYHHYYTDETRQIIADRCKEDIDAFGYTF